jgi:hypothetical protein
MKLQRRRTEKMKRTHVKTNDHKKKQYCVDKEIANLRKNSTHKLSKAAIKKVKKNIRIEKLKQKIKAREQLRKKTRRLCELSENKYLRENFNLKNPKVHQEITYSALTEDPNLVAFTFTVVFNKFPFNIMEKKRDQAIFFYKKSILNKVCKLMSRNPDNYPSVLPYYVFRYEKDQTPKKKPVSHGKNPHHIHSVIFVKSNLAKRIYDYELGSPRQRLIKDISRICFENGYKTTALVDCFQLEPLRLEDKFKWLNYINKDKCISSDDV